MKVTFQKLYEWHVKGATSAGNKPDYPTLKSYTTAFRHRYNITSETEVEFDRASNPISK